MKLSFRNKYTKALAARVYASPVKPIANGFVILAVGVSTIAFCAEAFPSSPYAEIIPGRDGRSFATVIAHGGAHSGERYEMNDMTCGDPANGKPASMWGAPADAQSGYLLKPGSGRVAADVCWSRERAGIRVYVQGRPSALYTDVARAMPYVTPPAFALVSHRALSKGSYARLSLVDTPELNLFKTPCKDPELVQFVADETTARGAKPGTVHALRAVERFAPSNPKDVALEACYVVTGNGFDLYEQREYESRAVVTVIPLEAPM